MYKLMIVDDEPSIRNGLKNIIDWEDLGIEIVCEASNGIEALQMIKIYRPTILLTDIRMPRMDGIQLIQEISKQYPSIKVAVLSGYDEFDYVRAVMRLGAANYILKPVDMEELISTMREIIESLGSDVQEFLKHREYLQLLQKNTLNRIITNQITLKEFHEKCEMLNISFQSSQMCVGVIQINNEEEDHWKTFASLNICDELIHAPEDCYIFPDNYNNVILIFKDFDMVKIKHHLHNCIQNIEKFLEADCISSAGTIVSSHKELGTSYQCALKLLNYQLLYGTGLVFPSTEYTTEILDSDTQIRFERLMDFIKKADCTEVRQYVDEIYSDLTSGHYSVNPSNIKFVIIDIISYVLYEVSSFNIAPEFLQHLKEEVYDHLQTASQAMQLKSVLTNFFDKLIDKIERLSQHNYSYPVKQAIDYVDDHYNDYNISLKTLSNVLSFNPAYLGRLFKLETNEYFSDYLSKKRTEKAYELLKNSTLKISQIVEMTGFSNISYFYTVFKKITGQNPGDVRKSDVKTGAMT